MKMIYHFIAASTLVLAFTPLFSQCNLSGYTFLGTYGGHTYLVSNSDSYLWNDANAQAIADGGHLVAINDAGENNFVAAALGGSGYLAWIGLNDAATEGTYVWSNGDAFTYSSWGAGEPNNANYGCYDEDYVEINRNGFGAWNDLPVTVCPTEITRAYVLEFDTDADSDCDGVLDPCDQCDGGDDGGPCNAESFPGFEDIPASWICDAGGHKVYVCHKGKTICIDYHAVQAHLNHGDFLGPCTGCIENRSFETGSLSLDVYPNPAGEVINLSFEGLNQDANVVIYDMMGRAVYKGIIKSNTDVMTISSSSFNAGTHFVKVLAGDMTIVKKIMIIQ